MPDLLIEDVARLPLLKAVGEDAHFCVSFMKKHGLLFEEFILCQKKLGVKVELVLFPATRFAYLFLMLHRVQVNLSVMRLVAESPTFALVKASTKKRGEEGKKALAEFKRFENLVESRSFKVRLLGGSSVMEPFSIALHYSEGDSTPLSHVLPVFQLLYDFSQQLDDFDVVTNFLEEEEDRDAIPDCVRNRWLGQGRLVGLKQDVHLLAFVLDPFVQGSLTTAEHPDCDLLDGEVLESARVALRHFSCDDHAKRAILLQQFMLWNAAAPRARLPPLGAGGNAEAIPVAQATGNNAFSALRLDAMQQVWNKVAARESHATVGDNTPRPAAVQDSSSAFAIREIIAKLRLTANPVEFWLAMSNETPRGATAQQKAAHMLFCRSAADISSIIGHTCGVERAGKAYKLVVSAMRKSMDESRASKSIFVFSNYNLREHKQSAGDAYSSFAVTADLSRGQDPAVDANQEQVHTNTLRRCNLIFNDVTEDASSECSGSEQGSGDEGEEGEVPAVQGAAVTAIDWYVPEGFKVAEEPAQLDSNLIGQSIYMRWEKYGWQLGKVTDVITRKTPRLFKKFNFRMVWADGTKGPAKLAAESYAFGADARYNSWVILEQAELLG